MLKAGRNYILVILVILTAQAAFSASVILNEYNAVKDTKYLENNGSDTYFGRVKGNGGDWFELVAVEDVDMRGWSFYWINEDSTEYEGWIYLSDNDFWSNIKAGTIITIIQDTAAHGGLDTDTSINYADDWWVNICTEQEQASYNTNPSGGWLARTDDTDLTGHFKVDNDDWALTIYDEDDKLVFGPAGEFLIKPDRGVGSDEILSLYNDPSTSVYPGDATDGMGYDDNHNSTFGSPNVSDDDDDVPLYTQDFSAFWGDPVNCIQALQLGFGVEGDFNSDCRVNYVDFWHIAPDWGKCFDPAGGCELPANTSPALILNEWNAVGSTNKYLDGGSYSDGGNNGLLEVDEYFASVDPDNLDGRIEGNGGNWMELVVTEDHLDIRGWKIKWAATDTADADQADGTDIWYGDPNIEQGVITFSDDSLWADLRAGTIITIGEPCEIGVDTDNYGGADKNFTNVDPSLLDVFIDLSTDTSFDVTPADVNDQDWWIHVSSLEEAGKGANALVTTLTNVIGDGPGNFSIGNDDWQATVTKEDNTVVFGPVGEAVSGWGGSGLNSREAGRLEGNPADVDSIINYDDGNASSFGQPNRWGNPVEVVQNFGKLRSWKTPPADCADAKAMGYSLEYDYNGNCKVDLEDISQKLMTNWLDCIVPGEAGCSQPWLSFLAKTDI